MGLGMQARLFNVYGIGIHKKLLSLIENNDEYVI